MKTENIIYQMTFAQDSKRGKGLIFPSELPDDETQSLLFVLSTPSKSHFIFELLKRDREKFLFPFQMGNEMYNLVGKYIVPNTLSFAIPNTDLKILFTFKLFPSGNKYLKYIGKYDNLIDKRNFFVPIEPINIDKMNELYFKYKGVFVGMTPNLEDLKF
jgi:hypothetical protein